MGLIDNKSSDRKRTGRLYIALIPVLCLVGIALFGKRGDGKSATDSNKQEVRIGYFPNVTHAPALVAVAHGELKGRLPDYKLTTRVVNAGPEAMEALLAGELDFSYVGPSPAINTYIKSKGAALELISGVCSGGASLISRKDVVIKSVKDLDGKRVAIPQIGGTQDVSLRHFLAENGLKSKEQGGTVEIIPVKNPDILALFLQKQIDAAWVPEPWSSKLKHDTGAVTVVDERDLWPNHKFPTTVLVVRKAYAETHPQVVQEVLAANLDAIDWISKNEAEAQGLVNAELKRLTGKSLADSVLKEAWTKVSFTDDPDEAGVKAFVNAAVQAGYIDAAKADVKALVNTTELQKAKTLKGSKTK